MEEYNISRSILEDYTQRLFNMLQTDVAIIGAGPSGLTAAYYLSKAGIKTAVFDKRLSIGGGIWGGAAGYSSISVKEKDILDEIGVRTKKKRGNYLARSIEFATGLCYRAVQSGAEIFNLIKFEDLIIKRGKIEGVVLNSSTISMAKLPVDPFCVCAKRVVDATGHEAEVVSILKRKVRDFSIKEPGEGPLDVARSEKALVEKTGEVYPRVYLTGMSVCAAYNLPRMGPVFGGMLQSGKKVAELIAISL